MVARRFWEAEETFESYIFDHAKPTRQEAVGREELEYQASESSTHDVA